MSCDTYLGSLTNLPSLKPWYTSAIAATMEWDNCDDSVSDNKDGGKILIVDLSGISSISDSSMLENPRTDDPSSPIPNLIRFSKLCLFPKTYFARNLPRTSVYLNWTKPVSIVFFSPCSIELLLVNDIV